MKKIFLKRSILWMLSLMPLILTGCGKDKGNENGEATELPAIHVRVQAAEQRDFERRLTVQGTLEAKTFATVAARVGGNLDSIWVDKGDEVIANETRLFQIDPIALTNAVTVAVQNLEVAKAGLAVAEATRDKIAAEAEKATLDFARYERLHKEGKVSNNEFETADIRNRQAKAGIAVAAAQEVLAKSQVDQAAAALAIAQKNLDDSLILAPISGVVSHRDAEPGEQMSVGQAILTIVDLNSIEAAAYIPAQYYSDITSGDTTFRLSIHGNGIGQYPIYYRSPTIHPSLRTFEIKGRIPDANGKIAPGSMVDITLVFEKRQGLAVPSEAILTRANQQVVFVAEDGRAVQTPVVIGFQNDGWSEILKGLPAGAKVICEGQTQLRDNLPVEVL